MPFLLLLAACGPASQAGKPGDSADGVADSGDSASDSADAADIDADGDGYVRATDCDDADATIHPGAEDPVDGIDQDCDGTVEGAAMAEVGFLELYGEHPTDNVGKAVSLADTDIDGLADLAVSAPGTDHTGPGGECAGWGGAVYVALGARWGSRPVSDTDGTIRGDAQQLSFGADLAWTLDATGDGGAELLVGAPGEFVTTAARVYLYASPVEGQIDVDDALLQVVAADPDARLGDAVDSAGDVDGDGVGDLLMGAPGATTGGEAAWVSGATRGELALSEADGLYHSKVSDWAGFAVAGAGDVDGDGYADMLVGSPAESSLLGDNTGTVYLIHGPAAGPRDLADADALITGDAAHQELGYALSAMGDIDGDARPDVLLGGPEMGETSGGSAWAVPGTITGTWTISAAASSRTSGADESGVGQALASADFDSDGVPELLVGTPSATNPDGVLSGAAYIARSDYTGTHELAVRGWMFWGAENLDLTGSSVAAGGDYDGDAVPDFAVGVVGALSYGGRAFVVPGTVVY